MDFNWKKLNFPEFRKSEHIKKYIADLKLRTDEEDNIYYYVNSFAYRSDYIDNKYRRISYVFRFKCVIRGLEIKCR